MSVIKKMLPVFIAATMSMSLFGCGEKDDSSTSDNSNSSEADSSSATENESEKDSDSNADESSDVEDATVQANIPLEYDGTDVNDDCADVINKYFTAIINQKYDDY